MTSFDVDIQPGTGFEFKNEVFTVRVEADGFDQAARRGIRRAISRAADWNDRHADSLSMRLTDPQAYRVVGVRNPEFGGAAPTAGATGATLVVALDVESVLAALASKLGR
ncbi:hypothetical protein [Rhodococcus sp. IEGM 1307]|uniref:hypothetical protein n=1 Tax=Rhodococcus sp. IEGM 1307 TaxID=3047091 RepID=UPI0024B7A2ED|nr:hypothetical protein [Rhodococcus sp. IEGM 1307]MDI9979441.1 hypothetical protein [Rhodococcus sp. IEGM 1307]